MPPPAGAALEPLDNSPGTYRDLDRALYQISRTTSRLCFCWMNLSFWRQTNT
ncbi:MAG: hypothetical protein IPG51_17515 [Chloroflexi bacterium]|nr:hypothetical protein [Chloroflexota bacterium]